MQQLKLLYVINTEWLTGGLPGHSELAPATQRGCSVLITSRLLTMIIFFFGDGAVFSFSGGRDVAGDGADVVSPGVCDMVRRPGPTKEREGLTSSRGGLVDGPAEVGEDAPGSRSELTGMLAVIMERNSSVGPSCAGTGRRLVSSITSIRDLETGV